MFLVITGLFPGYWAISKYYLALISEISKGQDSSGTTAQIWTTQVRCDPFKYCCCGPGAERKSSSHIPGDQGEAIDWIERGESHFAEEIGCEKNLSARGASPINGEQKGPV